MSIASEAKRCPNCGGPIPAEAPQGLCPKCLLLEVSIPTEAGQDAPAKSTPPGREELVAAFPNLEILELIGQGGMGYVFKARQPKIDRLVALKILPQTLAADPAFAERFTREGRLLARLNHPNIVTLHDFGQANGLFYLLMEFVDGVNLRQAMKAGRFTPGQALAVVPKICEALQYAHNEGVLHRDIKPENILLDTKGRVKIADFGVAKLVVEARAESKPSGTGEPPTDARLTDSGGTLGTPNYMAPEQIDKPSEVDHRADIYSLGVVFYEMLTGELPLGHFAPPSQKSSADPRLDDVVLRALAKKPEQRTQSAGEVKTQVETIASTVLVEAGKPLSENGGVRILSWARRNVVRIAIVIGLVLAVRFFALEPMVALTEGLAPEMSLSSHCLVWKLARNFSSGDVVVFRRNGDNYFGRVVNSFADSLVISRNTGPSQTVPRSSVIGLVILNTRARAEAGTVKSAVEAGTPTTDTQQGKTLVLAGATNELIGGAKPFRIVRVHTDSTLIPGETLVAVTRLPDGGDKAFQKFAAVTRFPYGQRGYGTTSFSIQRSLDHVQTSSYFSWSFPESFSPEDFEAAAAQLRQNKTGRPIVVNPDEPFGTIALFSVTNQYGGVLSGYLQFNRSVPEDPAGSDGKVYATVRLRPYPDFRLRKSGYDSGNLLIFYLADVPPGYFLEATANWSEVKDGQASTTLGGPDTVSSWMPPQTFDNESHRAADAQFRQLAKKGALQVFLGEPRLVFSITNKTGEVFKGFLELVGPPAAGNK